MHLFVKLNNNLDLPNLIFRSYFTFCKKVSELSYLSKAGYSTAVLERRHVVGNIVQ